MEDGSLPSPTNWWIRRGTQARVGRFWPLATPQQPRCRPRELPTWPSPRGGRHGAEPSSPVCRAVGFGAPAGGCAPRGAAGRLPRRQTCQLVPSQEMLLPHPCPCPPCPRPAQGTARLGKGFPTSGAVSRRRETAAAGWRAVAPSREGRGLGASSPQELWDDSSLILHLVYMLSV